MNLSQPDISAVVLMALACWRAASLLVNEVGPWDVCRRLRERVGILHDDTGTPSGVPDGMTGHLLGCVWCLSVWLAPAVWLVWTVAPTAVAVAAVAAIVPLIETWSERDG